MGIFKDKPDNFYGYYEDSDGNQYVVIKRPIINTTVFNALNSQPSATTTQYEKVLEDGSRLLNHQDDFMIADTGIIIRPCKD